MSQELSEMARPQTPNAVDAFHSHLDGCQQCATHPFDLCSTGHELLMATATTLADNDDALRRMVSR